MSKNVKQSILKFLQTKKFDLTRTVPGFVDAELGEDEGECFVKITLSTPLEDELVFSHDGTDLPVRTVVQDADKSSTTTGGKIVVMGADQKPHVMVPGSEGESDSVGVLAVPNEVAISPQTASSGTAKNKEAYEAWKARHRHVKVK